jgi:hypothetical protein
MSKGGGGGTQVVKNDPPKYLQPFLEQTAAEARSLYKEGAPPLYPNQTYTDMNSIQKNALQGTLNLANAGDPTVAAGQDYLTNLLQTPSGQNPYLDQMLEKYGQKANAMVTSNMNKAGRFGSGSHAGTAATAISEATLPHLFDQYNTDQQMKMAAAGLAPSMAQFDYDRMSRAGAVGDVYQNYDDLKLQDKMMRYNYDNGGGKAANLDDYIRRIYGNPTANMGSQTSNTKTSTGIGGTIGGIVSGMGALGGLGSGLSSFLGGGSALAGGLGGTAGTLGTIASFLGAFSDRRLKKDIVHVGKENGFNIYKFSYIDKPNRTFIGVMADEVEKIMPEAVFETSTGYKGVDYSKLGLVMREVSNGTSLPEEMLGAPSGCSPQGVDGESVDGAADAFVTGEGKKHASV